MMKLLGDREFGPAASLSWVFIGALVSFALIILAIVKRKSIKEKFQKEEV